MTIAVEARSLNHRHLDIALKLPRSLAGFEPESRRLIQGQVQRGRLEVSAGIAAALAGAGQVRVNAPLAREYMEQARALGKSLGLDGAATIEWVLGCPGVMTLDEPEPASPDDGWQLLARALTQAMTAVVASREREGEAIRKELAVLHDSLAAEVERMAARSAASLAHRRQRFKERIAALLGGTAIDESRLALEVAVWADRTDITEEVARLRAHLAEWDRLLGEGGSVGRTLDFLIQEMSRETNTIASKADDLELSQAAIAAKSLLEKLREQVQNIE